MALGSAVTGMIGFLESAIEGNGVPPSNLQGSVGQTYVDKSVSPRVLYQFDGQSWIRNTELNPDFTSIGITGGSATDYIGTATLSSGTVTVANTNIAASDKIFLSYEGSSISDSGQLSYTISAGVSFDIESTNGSDANDVSYLIVRTV